MTSDENDRPPTQGPDDGADGVSRRLAREAVLADGDDSIWSEAETGPDGDPPPPPNRRKRPEPKSSTRNMLEWAGVIVGAIVIAVVVRTFVFQTFWIPSPSMSPTLVKDDRVLVNKLSYKFHDVNRGDVVVFERPPNEPESSIKDLIKRVVGLPGERVSVLDGKVRIDGRELEESYTHGLDSLYNGACGSGDVTGIDTEKGFLIPDDHVFVMGDNRVNSADSRCFGPIDEDLIVGRAFFILWPPSKMGGL